jgi:septal ring-binding cell division protein DamX
VPEQLSEPELKQQRQTGLTPREPEAITQDSPVRNPIAAPRVVAQAPAPAPASSNVKDAKDAKSTKGAAEPRGLAPGFYVQHASRGTRAEVERFKAQNPVLSRARVIRLKRQGAPGDNWVLLSGPFASLDQARAFLARKGIPSDSWVRPASALRPLLAN